MLKNISYLLCGVFLCTFSLIAVADDPIPEVTVIGKTGDGNGSFLTGRGAQEYLAWATAQAGKSNAGTGSGSGGTGLNTSVKDTKEKKCQEMESNLDVAAKQCAKDTSDSVYSYYKGCVNSDAQGYSRCMDGKTDFTNTLVKDCELKDAKLLKAFKAECR